jgi:prepilin-type N-terminal cleavage/methylation domain-containing protein
MVDIDSEAAEASGSAGFTLIELMMAMVIFSFMLLIIVVGFMNIVRLHNEAVASNQAQDSARAAMDELVLAVRDSGGVTAAQPGLLCLASTTGQPTQYYVTANKTLSRADGCGGLRVNTHQITSDSVQVAEFLPEIVTNGGVVRKAQVQLLLTIGSANGTTTGTGASLQCGPTQSERTFCSTVTLRSEAVQR